MISSTSQPLNGIDRKSAPCLNCGSIRSSLWAEARDVEYVTSTSVFQYLLCADCDALFINPRPQDLAQIYPASYYSYAESGGSFAARVKAWLERRMFAKLLRQIPEEKLSVMDIGGGSGWILDQIRAADGRVKKTVIVDITESAAADARSRGHEFHCVPIEDFYTVEKFDLVLALNLIEHVRAPLEVLKKIASLLSPTGIALLKTPNYRSLDAAIFRHRNWGGYHCPRHWVLYNEASFRTAAGLAGLEIVRAKYTQGAPFWAVSLLACLANSGVIKISKEHPAYKHSLYQPFLVFSATFDFLRLPLAHTSQMFFYARRSRNQTPIGT